MAQNGQKMVPKVAKPNFSDLKKIACLSVTRVCECVDEWAEVIDWVGVGIAKQFPRIGDQHVRESVKSDIFFRESVNLSKISPLPRLGYNGEFFDRGNTVKTGKNRNLRILPDPLSLLSKSQQI